MCLAASKAVAGSCHGRLLWAGCTVKHLCFRVYCSRSYQLAFAICKSTVSLKSSPHLAQMSRMAIECLQQFYCTERTLDTILNCFFTKYIGFCMRWVRRHAPYSDLSLRDHVSIPLPLQLMKPCYMLVLHKRVVWRLTSI